MTAHTVMGPAGAPMRSPYGAFAPKMASAKSGHLTVMGPIGAPMRPPYGSFTGKGGVTGRIEWILRARRRHNR